MGNLNLHLDLDKTAALLAGETRSGYLSVPVTPALLDALTAEERLAIVRSVGDGDTWPWQDRLIVLGLSPAAIQAGARARIERAAEEAAAEEATAAKVRALFGGPVEGRLAFGLEGTFGARYQIADTARAIVGYAGENEERIREECSAANERDCAQEDERLLLEPTDSHLALDHYKQWVVAKPVNHQEYRRNRMVAVFPCAYERAHTEARRRNAEAEAFAKAAEAAEAEQFEAYVCAALTEEQVQRFRAGVLPVAERDEAIRAQLFAPFHAFARYVKLTREDLAHDDDCDGGSRFWVNNVAVRNSDMTAENFAIWRKLAEFCEQNSVTRLELREHVAACSACSAPDVIRLGAKVTVSLPGHTYSREFAL